MCYLCMCLVFVKYSHVIHSYVWPVLQAAVQAAEQATKQAASVTLTSTVKKHDQSNITCSCHS